MNDRLKLEREAEKQCNKDDITDSFNSFHKQFRAVHARSVTINMVIVLSLMAYPFILPSAFV